MNIMPPSGTFPKSTSGKGNFKRNFKCFAARGWRNSLTGDRRPPQNRGEFCCRGGEESARPSCSIWLARTHGYGLWPLHQVGHGRLGLVQANERGQSFLELGAGHDRVYKAVFEQVFSALEIFG